jgi:hypothetical protein
MPQDDRMGLRPERAIGCLKVALSQQRRATSKKSIHVDDLDQISQADSSPARDLATAPALTQEQHTPARFSFLKGMTPEGEPFDV